MIAKMVKKCAISSYGPGWLYRSHAQPPALISAAIIKIRSKIFGSLCSNLTNRNEISKKPPSVSAGSHLPWISTTTIAIASRPCKTQANIR